MKISIAVLDSHRLFAEAMTQLINSFKNFQVTLTTSTGKELVERLRSEQTHPEIILIHFHRLDMSVDELLNTIKKLSPQIKTAALFMGRRQLPIISLFRGGCYSFILKTISPKEMENVLKTIHNKGYYLGDLGDSGYPHDFSPDDADGPLTEEEKKFLKSICDRFP